MKTTRLLTVESSFVLTGLGVLVRGATAPGTLSQFERHMALAVVLVFADGREVAVVASVEEVTRPSPTDEREALTEQALLLQLSEPVALLPGTEIWLTGQPLEDDKL